MMRNEKVWHLLPLSDISPVW